MRRRVLVSGGTGFVGSHLCERLLERGDDVLCVDNDYTGTRDDVTHLLDHPHFELMRHDATFPLSVEVDQIYNLACPASPIHYQREPGQTTKTSVHGAITMLGDGARSRSFCFVDDLVEGLILLMDTPDDVTGPVSRGSPVEFTMLELAQRVLELTGSGSDIVIKPLPQDDPRQRQPNIDQARVLLGSAPNVQLDEGLQRTSTLSAQYRILLRATHGSRAGRAASGVRSESSCERLRPLSPIGPNTPPRSAASASRSSPGEVSWRTMPVPPSRDQDSEVRGSCS